MPIVKRKKKVRIAEARRFKDRIGVPIEEEGRITAGVNLPLGATPKDIDEAVKRALYREVGQRMPELEGREIEVEYEEEVQK